MEKLILLAMTLIGAYAQDSISTLCTSTSNSKRFCSSSNCGNSEIIFCLGENQGFKVNCVAPKQYCVENKPGEAICSETSHGCGSEFFCTGEGIFPDPLDCKKYHYCVAKNNKFTSSSYECPDRYVFDPDSSNTNYCRLTNNFYCTVPNCRDSDKMKNVLFLYPFFPYNRQFVALCIPKEVPKVYKCPDGYYAELSTIPVTCSFKCRSPGLFPYPANENLFYECYYNAHNQLVQKIGSCFENWIFVENKCQPSTSTASSSSMSPSTTSSLIVTESSTAPTSTPIIVESSSTLNEASTLTSSIGTSEKDVEATTEPLDETSQSTGQLPTSESSISDTTCIKPPC